MPAATVVVTVPTASVPSTLTNYPLYVDLSTLPSCFWDNLVHDDGGDIRVTDADGVALAFDVVGINRAVESGVLFVKIPSLSSTSATSIRISVGTAANTFLGVGHANGRNAVWSDYHRVFLLGAYDGGVDRTGNGTRTSLNKQCSAFTQVDVSGETNSHQGVCWDGTYFYVTGTNSIKKYNASWVLQATNSNPCGDIGNGVDHLGDPEIVAGVLYIPAEQFTPGSPPVGPTSWGSERIARFNPTTLALIDSVDISSVQDEISSLAYVEADDMLYATSFVQFSTLYKYRRSDLAFQGTVTLSEPLKRAQGITHWAGKFYINVDDGAGDDTWTQKATYLVQVDGSVLGPVVWFEDTDVNNHFWEGISHKDDRLLALFSTGLNNGRIYELTPTSADAYSGLRLKTNALGAVTTYGYALAAGLTRFTTWTLGLTVRFTKGATTQNFVNYTVNGSTDDTKRAAMGWRQSTDRLGIWNDADGWVTGGSAPSSSTRYRMHDRHNDTADRRYYENGAFQANDLTITAMPDASANAVYIGAEDADVTNNPIDGEIAFFYLRNSLLSDNWITTENANLANPGTFYSVAIADPEVDTLAATNVRSTAATIRGRVQGITCFSGLTSWLRWDTVSPPVANQTTIRTVSSDPFGWTAALSGLEPETTYYFRAVVTDGTDDFLGEILSFTTVGEQTFVDGTVSFPLAWLELTKRDETMKPFAEVDLNDAPTYYGGYKAPWVKRFHGITRGLSDRDGQIEHLNFGALFADTTKYFRELLSDVVNKYLTNRPTVVRFIDDEDRRIEGLPRIAAVGYVNDYTPRENLQFDLKCADWLKKKFSRKRKAQQSWQPLITADDFPNCPEDTLQKAAPIIYGSLGLTGADPVENVQITVNAQPTAAPTGFALSLQAGGRLAGVRRYYRVSAIVGGVETDQTATLTTVTTDTNKTIRLTWNAVASATAIYVYSSHRPDFAQFAYTVLAGGATSYDDDTTPPNQDANWLTGTDWLLGLRLNLTYYVYAALGNGLYSRPGIATVSIMPLPLDQALQDRDIDVTWDAHAGETDGYRVVRHRSYYTNWNPVFDRQWDVAHASPTPLTVTDDVVTTTAVAVPAGELIAAKAAGEVEAIFVGAMPFGSPAQTLNVGLIARHACSRVGNIYLPVTTENVEGETETTYEPIADSEYGSTWFAPDHPGWLYSEKFVDINGRRYTLIATTVSPWPDKVLVDVDGVETDGDGAGALIRSIVRQRLHFMNNFIAPDTPWQSGPYLTANDTTFPHIPTLPLVDEASHDDVEAALEARIAGGYEGAGIIGEGGAFVSATDVLARFHVSGDFDQVWNRKGQDSISAEPITPAVDPPTITDVISIADGSFSITDQVQTAFFNIQPYVHTKDYTGRSKNGWYGVGEERSQTSIDNYDQERESPRFELHFLRANTPQGAATIADVMARKKARYRDPRRVGTLRMPFSGLNYEPGSTAALTHIEGIGANGWNGREVRFTRHEVFPTEGSIQLDFYDLTALFDAVLVTDNTDDTMTTEDGSAVLVVDGA